ncbi:MAG: hypothetical protein IPP07_08185 [Holophagales bacterium]|jgi:hypothetical protein|nr:hypothetical protein [Holophagales bacterium]MBK9964871.1 hypothetical protein [Holophagales bacterium]
MKTFFCSLFSLAALAVLVASPVSADDVGVFRLGQTVRVADVELPAGVYAFRATDRGVVYVCDDEQPSKVIATVLTRRHGLKLAETEMAGTLSHDWTVRSLALGNWSYDFTPGKAPVTVAAVPTMTTVVAMALHH